MQVLEWEALKCSPHLRGLTAQPFAAGAKANVFPAPAGINRDMHARFRLAISVPRTCGD